MHELILGGQRSGKSRCAEARAAAWLAAPGCEAVLVATAIAGDAEMAARIERHRADRADRMPLLATEEVPRELPRAITRLSSAQRLIVVDCLTLWLTNLQMPIAAEALAGAAIEAMFADLLAALVAAPGPVVLVSNEVGGGLVATSAEARRFVDDIGRLHQRVAAGCKRVTWMVAGIEVAVKGELA
jgi:adenosylcobinamide kinase/adenosylcobinamide-phosphate guanylyltransferase